MRRGRDRHGTDAGPRSDYRRRRDPSTRRGSVGGKKKKLLAEGVQARAVIINVQDTGVTINENPRVKLTLQVQPEGEVPFQAEKKVTVSRVSIPRAGDEYVVRYDPADPGKVEFDTAAAAQANASVQTQVAEASASQIPSDLAANGILGRGACVDVQKTPVGQLTDCAMTVGVRLVDGTPSYKTTTRISLSPENAAKLIPHQTLFTVRADPQNHQRVAVSLGEPTPIVTIDDPSVVDPPARALRDGAPCRVTLVAHSEQFLRLPSGEDLYAAKVQVAEDGSELQVFLPVPASAADLVQDGKQYPAKRLPAEPNVLTVDWVAARQEAGASAMLA